MTRREYQKGMLLETEVAKSPIDQFAQWFEQAKNSSNPEPNAFALASVQPESYPTARMLLLKSFDEHGFVFVSNYESRKAKDLAAYPKACMLFYWGELERQIRIEGDVKLADSSISDQAFLGRPKGSRLAAIVSRQSEIINSREELDLAYDAAQEKYLDSEPERPANWGAYVLDPVIVEFWQGRENRLHDRILYAKELNLWKISRLAP